MRSKLSAGDPASNNYCNGACCPDAADVCVDDHVTGGKICCAPLERSHIILMALAK